MNQIKPSLPKPENEYASATARGPPRTLGILRSLDLSKASGCGPKWSSRPLSHGLIYMPAVVYRDLRGALSYERHCSATPFPKPFVMARDTHRRYLPHWIIRCIYQRKNPGLGGRIRHSRGKFKSPSPMPNWLFGPGQTYSYPHVNGDLWFNEAFPLILCIFLLASDCLLNVWE